MEIPVMKIETGSGKEFFIGLAINDPQCGSDQPPDYVVDIFQSIGRPLTSPDRATWPTSADDVDSFLGGSFEWNHLTSPLIFEPDSNLALPDSLCETEELNDYENSETYDKLLWWCSSMGSGTVYQISEVAENLRIGELAGGIWSVLKKLSLLGHLDVTFNQDRGWFWRISPLTLVEFDSGRAAYLAGAQSGNLRKLLIDELGASLQDTNGGPFRVSLLAESLAHLKSLIGYTPRHAVDTVSRWAEMLPTIDEWQSNLKADPDIANQPNKYKFERYAGNYFQQVSRNELLEGLYRVQRDGEQFSKKSVFRATDGRWLNGDFATLRFLSLLSKDQNPQAKIVDDGALIMPLEHRWPTLYERALVLASGRLPTMQTTSKSRFLAYSDVPKKSVITLTKKLCVKLKSKLN
jgi:hypothetical protein